MGRQFNTLAAQINLMIYQVIYVCVPSVDDSFCAACRLIPSWIQSRTIIICFLIIISAVDYTGSPMAIVTRQAYEYGSSPVIFMQSDSTLSTALHSLFNEHRAWFLEFLDRKSVV